ncbi:6-phosphogluconolactonase [Taibaiella soli]|nr:6-phosphogluconolactonase [Taibaiella soli]
MDAKNEIKVFPTLDALDEATAALIITIAKSAVADKGRFTISLSGGQTPQRLYKLLAGPEYSMQMVWDKTFVFWGDERCVPPDDEQNNAHMARTALLDHITIPAANIYPVPVELSPEPAAHKYERQIKDFFLGQPPAFDLILLGLGENGHTASLFPGTDALGESDRLIKDVYVTEQKMYRITMTAKLINEADNIIFLAAGSNKAAILSKVIVGPYQPDTYPAQYIQPKHGMLYWYLDKQAAALLPQDITGHH